MASRDITVLNAWGNDAVSMKILLAVVNSITFRYYCPRSRFFLYPDDHIDAMTLLPGFYDDLAGVKALMDLDKRFQMPKGWFDDFYDSALQATVRKFIAKILANTPLKLDGDSIVPNPPEVELLKFPDKLSWNWLSDCPFGQRGKLAKKYSKILTGRNASVLNAWGNDSRVFKVLLTISGVLAYYFFLGDIYTLFHPDDEVMAVIYDSSTCDNESEEVVEEIAKLFRIQSEPLFLLLNANKHSTMREFVQLILSQTPLEIL